MVAFKKEKHTTYRIPKGLTKDEHRETLEGVLTSLRWEKVLLYGIDSFFDATKNIKGVHSGSKASLHWVQTEFQAPWTGYVTSPAGWLGVALYSKKLFSHPQLSFRASFPPLLRRGASIWVGFEDGSEAGNGLLGFYWWNPDGVNNFMYAIIVSDFFKVSRAVHITPLLPPDFQTVKHAYRVELTEPMAVWYVDGVAVAYGLITPNSYFTGIGGPPYGLFSIETPIPQVIPSLIEVGGQELELVFPLSPHDFRVSDGHACPSRILRLYVQASNTLLAGYSLAAGSVTSHPVPVHGYRNKSFHFRANQNGDIDIEVLMHTGNWRIYAPDAGGHTESNYVADTLWSFVMTGDAVLARLTFTPDAYPCTVAEAEVNLR